MQHAQTAQAVQDEYPALLCGDGLPAWHGSVSRVLEPDRHNFNASLLILVTAAQGLFQHGAIGVFER